MCTLLAPLGRLPSQEDRASTLVLHLRRSYLVCNLCSAKSPDLTKFQGYKHRTVPDQGCPGRYQLDIGCTLWRRLLADKNLLGMVRTDIAQALS